MANDKRMKIRYAGYGQNGNEKPYLLAEIGEDEYYSLRYLLWLASIMQKDKMQNEDAVNLRQSLADAWHTMQEEIEYSTDE